MDSLTKPLNQLFKIYEKKYLKKYIKTIENLKKRSIIIACKNKLNKGVTR